MSREDDLRLIFKDKLNTRDEVLVKEWVDKNKCLCRIEVPIKTLAVLFPVEIRDDDNVLGYKKFIEDCKTEKLI